MESDSESLDFMEVDDFSDNQMEETPDNTVSEGSNDNNKLSDSVAANSPEAIQVLEKESEQSENKVPGSDSNLDSKDLEEKSDSLADSKKPMSASSDHSKSSRFSRERRKSTQKRSRSRSRGRRRKSRSRSSVKHKKSRSRSRRRSRSKSKEKRKRSCSKSKENRKKSRSRSKEKQKRSRSKSKENRKKSRSRSKERQRRSRSRSKEKGKSSSKSRSRKSSSYQKSINKRKRKRRSRSRSNSDKEETRKEKKAATPSSVKPKEAKRRRVTSPFSDRCRHVGSVEKPPPSPSIVVFGLPLTFTDEELVNMASPETGDAEFSLPTSASIAMDRRSGISRGFGFLNYPDIVRANIAMDYLQTRCMFVTKTPGVTCKFSVTHRAHSPTPSYYLGCKKTKRGLKNASTLVKLQSGLMKLGKKKAPNTNLLDMF